MATCKIEERDAGRAYPRTCPTCKLGPCRKGHSKALAPTPKENPMTQDDEAERLIAALSSQIGDDVSVIFNHESLFKRSRDTIRTQAARIAELEAKLQAVLRREEDDNRAAFAHMRRAEAAEAEVARLREALGDIAHQKKTTEFAYPAFRDEADFEGGYDECVTRARAALHKQDDV